MLERDSIIRMTAAILCLSGILSSCAGGENFPGLRATHAQKQSSLSNACPAQHQEYISNVDISLDQLSTEELATLANTGRTEAMVLLALRYARPDNISDANANPTPDTDKAMALLRRAADKNSADAEYLMGAAFINGLGVLKDEAKAAYWLERGARHGHAAALFWFGEMTAKGRGGLTSDWERALPYFKRAAARGVPDAFLEIGYMYSNGLGGLEQDNQKAAFCYRQVVKKSQIVQFNLRRLIEDGKISWQPGDPGVPPEKHEDSPSPGQ